jgi:hypothetical protein
MKTLKNYKLILLAIIFFLSSACVYAYPPDNAAVLYYKAAMLYKPDDKMEKTIRDFSKETADLSKVDIDKIREFVNKNRSIINMVLDASKVKNCDWGADYSQGLQSELAPLREFMNLAQLVIADAKILTKDGNYETALSRCINLYKMARHLNDRAIVVYCMYAAINYRTNDCVMQILSDMPQDIQNLSRLKERLAEIGGPFSVKLAILGDRDAVLISAPEILTDDKCLKEVLKGKTLSFDDAMIERNKKYGENYYTGIIAAFNMPYVQGYAAMKDLTEKVRKDVSGNPDATLTAIVMPPMGKVFSIVTRLQTYDNAIRAAIEIYMIKAKTGKLPEELPADLPCDLFSGKPFNYAKTPDGFILRCQGKNLGNDETYEYKFKVKK